MKAKGETIQYELMQQEEDLRHKRAHPAWKYQPRPSEKRQQKGKKQYLTSSHSVDASLDLAPKYKDEKAHTAYGGSCISESRLIGVDGAPHDLPLVSNASDF